MMIEADKDKDKEEDTKVLGVDYGLPAAGDEGPLYIAGLRWGQHVPKDLIIDAKDWHNVILVTKQYLLDNINHIVEWAKSH